MLDAVDRGPARLGESTPRVRREGLQIATGPFRIQHPEGELALAQAVVHLATAPKSVAVYEAFKAAKKAAAETGSLMPPAHIRNAPTKLMKQLGYGKGYQYDPSTETGFSGANYFPDEMERRTFYEPTEHGYERHIRDRLTQWARLRDRKQRPPPPEGHPPEGSSA